MAIKTMTGAEPSQNAYERGWHTVTISGAKEPLHCATRLFQP